MTHPATHLATTHDDDVLDVVEVPTPRLQSVPALQTGGVVDATPAWYAARGRTDTARQAIATASAWAEVAADLIKRAWDCRDDVVLGYATWEEYVAVEFEGVRDLKLPADGRRRIVAALDTAGMSSRKGAAPLGISEGTWRLDLAALEESGYVRHGRQQAALAAVAALPAARKGPVARTRVQRFLDLLEAAGAEGLTMKETRRKMRDVPDPGAIASELHTRHVIARLAQHEETGTREGWAVYVRHEHVGLRDVEAPGRRCRRAAAAGAAPAVTVVR